MEKMVLFSVIILSLIFMACSGERQSKKMRTEEVEISAPVSSLAAEHAETDTLHLFIRSAEYKFRVDDVYEATWQIEDLVRTNGGYIAYTHLTTTTEPVQKIQVAPDSVAETTSYITTNVFQIRVPDHLLDTALKGLRPVIGFMDYRIIRADEVSTDMMAERLSQKRSGEARNQIDKLLTTGGHKLNDITHAMDNQFSRASERDNARVQLLKMKKDIEWSSVHVEIYQDPVTKTLIRTRDTPVKEFKPGFLNRMAGAFSRGWEMLEDLLVALARIWILIIGIITGFLVRRKIKSVFRLSRSN